MKRIIALCVASAVSMASYAGDDADQPLHPVIEVRSAEQMSKEGMSEHKKAIEGLKAKLEELGELERLAIPIGAWRGATREQLLPYRFSDVTKLQSMLRDPEWKNQWHHIAAAIAIVADKKAALELVEFVKSPAASSDHRKEWNKARSTAVAALGYTLINQDIPEVLEFIERLADDKYAESLKLGNSQKAQLGAYATLYLAATDDSIALLENILDRKIAEKENKTVQALSIGEQPDSNSSNKTNKQIRMLEMYLNDAKRVRAGVSPESSNEMP